ncbi:hypothetical protein FHS07_001536 [Microbacterium proteolyticum]|uniref:SHOCT domain-containing protein n=1 Tax=Microbacterium proteolyticum TaxID=1572644 RepID=A0A7W5CHQ2_9MICO|nr:SHOCT domain-containing protein [Microbacterium proteolyticum]MBB3157852.1 hypothetical protein [Microbacterium proteolyticum]
MSVLPPLWDLIVWFFYIFVVVAYLMVIFSIVGDLFRDRSLSGWWKALWMLCLVIVPFITAFVYLIARGRGMAERQAGEARAARDATDTYIREVAGFSATDEITKAKALKDAGAISDAEYEALKAKALAHP